MKTSRYTDEQLSMLLGEHDRLGLVIGGARHWGFGQACAVQVMQNIPVPLMATIADIHLAYVFDANYDPQMSPEELLALVAQADEERWR